MLREKKALFNEEINVDQIKNLIEKPINDLNYQLVEINIYQESGNTFLQIVIDGEKGINLDDCIKVTHLVNPILDDNESLFKNPYILDVASKGVEN